MDISKRPVPTHRITVDTMLYNEHYELTGVSAGAFATVDSTGFTDGTGVIVYQDGWRLVGFVANNDIEPLDEDERNGLYCQQLQAAEGGA